MQAYPLKAAFLSFLIVVAPAWAHAMITLSPAKKINPPICVCPVPHLPSWYVDAGLGWVFNQKLGTTYLANLDLGPENDEIYTGPKVKRVPMGFLSGGYVWSRQANWFPMTSLGLEYSYAMPAKTVGTLETYSDPSDSHEYQYKVSHHTLQLVGKVDLLRWQQWMPYLSAGLGTTWNRFARYSEEPLAGREKPSPEFPSKTKLNFSYSLGTGVDYIFAKNLWGSLGYRYDHLGWIKTGDSNREFFTGDKLKDTLQAHTLVLSLRYLFG